MNLLYASIPLIAVLILVALPCLAVVWLIRKPIGKLNVDSNVRRRSQ